MKTKKITSRSVSQGKSRPTKALSSVLPKMSTSRITQVEDLKSKNRLNGLTASQTPLGLQQQTSESQLIRSPYKTESSLTLQQSEGKLDNLLYIKTVSPALLNSQQSANGENITAKSLIFAKKLEIATEPDVLAKTSSKIAKDLSNVREPRKTKSFANRTHSESVHRTTISTLSQEKSTTPRGLDSNSLAKIYSHSKETTPVSLAQKNRRVQKSTLTKIGEENPVPLKDKLPTFRRASEKQLGNNSNSAIVMSSTTKVAEAFKIKTKAHFISKPNNVSSKTSPTKFVNGQAATTSSKLLSKPAEDSKNKKENLSASALIVTGGTDLTRSMKGTLSSTAMRSKSPNARLGSSALMNVKSMRIEQRPEEKDKKKSGYNAPATMSRNYKYCLGGGNNSNLIRRVLSAREGWEEIEGFNSLFNLKWQQTYHGVRFERLTGTNPKQLVNHFEFHKEISTKNGLIRNLASYCDQNKIELFDLTPVTFMFDMDNEASFEQDLNTFAHFFRNHCGDPKSFCDSSSGTRKTPPNTFFTFEFKRSGKRYSVPETLSPDKKASIYTKPKPYDTYFRGSNLWLLKPTGFNRGMGIEIFNSLESLNKYLNEYVDTVEAAPVVKKNVKPEDASDSDSSGGEENGAEKKRKKGPPMGSTKVKSRTFVVQKYIESPLLVYNRKFDFRVYAMVTHEMKLYFFKEGYLRTSSEEFTLGSNDIDNKFIHLTNDAVQKYSDNYGVQENGNKLSYKQLDAYMKEHNIPMDLEGKIVPRMKELVQMSMNSIASKLNANQRKYSFEIFGYDFIMDSDLNVWLIEVNTNPCLEEASPLQAQLIPRMINDAFKLTVDVMFPRKCKKVAEKEEITIVQGGISESKQVVEKEEITIVQAGISEVSTSPSDKEKTPPRESSPVKDASPIKEAKADKSYFPLDGYSDSENVWEYLNTLDTTKGSPRKAR